MSEDEQQQRVSPVLPDIRRLLEDPDLSDDGREELRALLLNPRLCRIVMEEVDDSLRDLRETFARPATSSVQYQVQDPVAQSLLILAGMAYHSDKARIERESAYYLEEFLEQRADKRDAQEEEERRARERELKRQRELEERKAKAALKKTTDEQAAEVVVEKRKTPDTPAAPASSSKRRRRIEPPLAPLSPALE